MKVTITGQMTGMYNGRPKFHSPRTRCFDNFWGKAKKYVCVSGYMKFQIGMVVKIYFLVC